MTTEQIKVLERKYSEPRIEKMSDAEILTRSGDCLKRIHIITGWNLPDDKDYVKILIEELAQKLKEDFATLNFLVS